ncbi:hypothetical protein Q4Q39_19095 [Flavivirga amylovorans]|uniref:Uncharacterized protein n=1 Tax=Flavivirga amylovorans TaxID=870486 RepID=A0ABT8X696_9FLAO|nr:hypothetical protein [Flavivirga amylovorans]MDO5989516.1 hypothetical protein [Flavivirga amylovorans]
MNPYKSDKFRFILGLIFIIIIYSCYHFFFVENKNTTFLSRKTSHVIKFSVTIAVYFVGTFHLGKLKDTWMLSLWHFVHISGLCIITLLGLYIWFIYEISISIRAFAQAIQELLISPALYVVMGLLNRSLKKGYIK